MCNWVLEAMAIRLKAVAQKRHVCFVCALFVSEGAHTKAVLTGAANSVAYFRTRRFYRGFARMRTAHTLPNWHHCWECLLFKPPTDPANAHDPLQTATRPLVHTAKVRRVTLVDPLGQAS